MEFLAALIAVMLVQLWGSGAPLHRDGWFLQWCQWCARLLGSGSTLLPIVAVSIPVFVLLVVYYGISDQWWGLPKLAMLVAILLYSLGRGDFRRALEGYAQAWRAGNAEDTRRILRGFDFPATDRPVTDRPATDRPATDRPITDMPPTMAARHAQARSRLLYRGFERMFAVLFWFALAGPALALAYRLAFLYRHRIVAADNALAVALADQLLAVFEWLPARALALSFALVGNIRDGVRAWIDLSWQYGRASSAYLDAMYAVVSGFENSVMVAAGETEAAFIARADDELRQIQVLLNRALVFWLAAMALMQLIL